MQQSNPEIAAVVDSSAESEQDTCVDPYIYQPGPSLFSFFTDKSKLIPRFFDGSYISLYSHG
jgi:hypothetical protein